MIDPKQPTTTRNERRPATVKDVARLASVSIGTVDRVLHNRGRVSNETAERVRSAVRRLDYSPNVNASNLSRSRTTVFGALVPYPDQDGGYWRLALAGVEAALNELSHHYIAARYYHFDRTDGASFRAAASRLLGDGCDGVLLAPTVSDDSLVFVSQLGEVPCVVFDGDVPGASVLSTINQDSFESGLLAGKLIRMIDPAGPYLTVTIGSADYHLQRRREGFVRYFELNGEVTVDHLEIDEAPAPGRVSARLRARLRNSRRPGSVFVTNALAHLVARELNERVPHTPIVGYDLIAENTACLREGAIDFVINQDPGRQGYYGLLTLYRHVVLHERVEPRIRMPIDLVMRENLDLHLEPAPEAADSGGRG